MSAYRKLLIALAGISGVALMAACSTRPDVEDVTNINAVDIMRRIQCEAAFRIEFQHKKHKYDVLDEEFEKTKDDFKKEQEKLVSKIARYQTEFSRVPWERSEARANLRVQLLQQRTRMERLLAKPEADRNVSDEAHAQSLLAEADRLLLQSERLKRAVRGDSELNEAANALTKLEKARLDRFGALLKFESSAVVMEFLFTMTEDNDASTENTITWPIALGSFSLKLAAGDKKKRAVEKLAKISATFDDLLKLVAKGDCKDVGFVRDTARPVRYPISGNIGLDRIIDDFMSVVDRKLAFPAEEKNEVFREKITFTTVVDGSLTPGASLSKKIGPATISLSAGLAAKRTDAHQVTILIKPGTDREKKEDTKQQEIIIRSIPDLRTRMLGPAALD